MRKVPYIVGDIHGCYQTFLRLEQKIFLHARKLHCRPLIICTGDLIDRGPESAAVVEHFRLGLIQGTHMSVLGNHEAEFLVNLQAAKPKLFDGSRIEFPDTLTTVADSFSAGNTRYALWDDYVAFRRINWLSQGGLETLLSYKSNPLDPSTWKVPKTHVAFLASLPLFWENRMLIVTHGTAFKKSMDKLPYEILKHHLIRRRGDNTDLNLLKAAADAFLWSRKKPLLPLNDQKLQITGHTPMKRPLRIRKINMMRLDTGCVYGRRLTAYCQTTDEFLSTPS